MNSDYFIIIAETETTGFVVDVLDHEEDAKMRAEYIFNNYHLFEYPEFKSELEQLNIVKTYTFQEQFIPAKQMIWGFCNGFFNVDVLKVDHKFSLSAFIKERSEMVSEEEEKE